MSLRIWMINLFMSLLIFFFGLKTYTVWSDAGDPEAATEATAETKSELTELPPPESAPPPSDFYEGIAEKNLFSEDRKEPVSEGGEEKSGASESSISATGILLTGTIITEGYRAALVTGGPTPKGKWVREGERFNGLEVASIQKDKILLKEGERQIELRLYEGKRKNKKRIAVVGQQHPVVVSSNNGKTDQKTTVNEGSGEKPKEQEKGEAAPKAVVGTKNPLSISKKAEAKKNEDNSPPADIEEKEGDVEYEIIQTPFGKFKRKKR